MTSVSDYEWTRLARTWTEVGELDRADWIRERVRRKTRLLRWAVVGEVVVTVSALVMLAALTQPHRTAESIVVAVATLAHTAICWSFAIWNRTGIWRPLGESTRDYLILARERCRRERRSARFVLTLVGLETVAIVIWIAGSDRAPGSGGTLPIWWLSPAIVTAGAIGWAVWADRRARRELERLDSVAGSLGFGAV